MEENWRPVAGYEGYYSVSDLGQVRRDAGGRGARAGRVLKGSDNGKGYIFVQLHRDGSRDMVFVHSIVMAAFVGPRPPGLDINHKNGVKGDNRLENLEYATHADNVRHGYQIGLKPRLIGGSNGAVILTEPDVRQIRAALAQGERQSALARQYGVSNSAIHCIASGKRWRHVA